MNRKELFGLLALGMLWGASFLFIRVAVPEFGAVPLMAVRVTLAAVVLVPLLVRRRQVRLAWRHRHAIALIGILHYALPFSLFAYSMLTLSAGYSSVINASAPLFAGLVGWFWLGERLDAGRTTGLVTGVAGVVILVWDQLAIGDGPVVLAALASVLAAFCYGLAAVLAKKKLAGVDPTVTAGGSMVAAALVLLPLSFWLWPATMPTLTAWTMAGLLGVACTAAAFVIYFRLISAVGPSRAITVTFLIPLFAVVFGALFIDEKITGMMIVGGVIVAFGTALSTGLVKAGALKRALGVIPTRASAPLMAVTLVGGVLSDARADAWHIDTPVYVASNSFSYRATGGWDSFSTLATSAELEIRRVGSPWAINLFTEYHLSADDRVLGTVFAGIQGSFFRKSWDLSGFWFTSRYPGRASQATFMTRLRYEFRPGHKIGSEYLASVAAPRAGELKLGYYAAIAESVSLKFLVGAIPTEDWQPLARLELSWRVK